MKRFVTLVTVALVGAAVLAQWQRVKELARQVLSRRGEKESVSADENKAIVRRVSDEVFNQGNLSVVDELIAPDYVLHDPGVPGEELRGLEAFKERWVSMFRTAFPDLRIVIEDQVAEGEKVASRYTGSGTHQGDLTADFSVIDPYRMMRTDSSARKATLDRSCMHGVCGSIYQRNPL